MKKNIVLFCCLFFFLVSNAQQWAGSATTTGLINRDGHVLIGTTPLQGTYGTDTRVIQVRGLSSVVGLRSTSGAGSLDIVFSPSNGGTNFNSVGYPLSLSTESASRLKILTNGFVGIGTETPGYKLEVNGNTRFTVTTIGTGTITTPTGYSLYVAQGILAEKVKVALPGSSSWSDYVFGDDYKLSPLSQVERFIKNNRHLPGIPSANELVKNGGIDVNEMFAKQMAKIEELTLYIIEQNKEIGRLSARVTQLEKK